MYKIIKRFFDITLSTLVMLVLAPLLVPIMVGLRFTGEGEVWYKQKRIGFTNKPFLILKFATMLKNSSKMKGGIITTKKDSRITPMGGFLRKSKINELPQLINIFKGDMSFVGPRPLMLISFETYTKDVQDVIYNVKPGLTGIGSIVFRDEEQLMTEVKEKGEDTWAFYSTKIYPFKGKLELWYQQNRSFTLDLQLILITIWVVLFPESTIICKWFKDLPKRSF